MITLKNYVTHSTCLQKVLMPGFQMHCKLIFPVFWNVAIVIYLYHFSFMRKKIKIRISSAHLLKLPKTRITFTSVA
ncbi:hypothetical protein Avbf_17271 [Armadillidium vulgare]|nr:hypothetical protein Avbf_17271 [Armadillidium vulgare]